ARKDLLSGFFFLLSLCTYLRWRERVTPSGDEGRHNFSLVSWFVSAHHDKWYFVSLLSFLLGLLAKVSIAPLPIILLLIDWLFPQRANEKRATYVRLLPYFALSIVFGVIAMFGKTGNTELFSEKILIGAKATMFYLEKLLWPTGLSVLYPYTQSITWTNPDLLLPLIVVLSLSAVAFSLRKKAPMVCFGWAFFLLILLPSFTNFAKGHDELRDVYFASDRYTYLPSIGIFLLSASLIYKLHTTHYKLRMILLSLLLPLSILSYRQSLVWRNTETLFRNVAEQYPTSHIAWNNLGSLALERLDITTAMKDYERSLTIRPNAAAFFNLGQIAMKKGLVREAMELYRRAVASRPNDTDSLLNLGVLHLRTGDAATAADLFRRAVAFDDRLAIAHFNLGLALEAIGDRDGARQAFTRALALDPNDEEAREKLGVRSQ
ncbi:tetratricopeptide repeat protein, partial [Candidatus Peregrinibacteria bacterium]|nr:tetratricopeptide repeat protein [Candidatus Peregrinibacteria bacterium]